MIFGKVVSIHAVSTTMNGGMRMVSVFVKGVMAGMRNAIVIRMRGCWRGRSSNRQLQFTSESNLELYKTMSEEVYQPAHHSRRVSLESKPRVPQ